MAFRLCRRIASFNPKPEAMADSAMDRPHLAPAIASGFGLNEEDYEQLLSTPIEYWSPTMARITVNVFANLREYTGGAPSVDVDIEPGQTIADVLAHLEIPPTETKIIFVDNRHAGLDHELQGDERLDLFSALGGG